MHGYNYTMRRGVLARGVKVCCVLGIAALLAGCSSNSKVGRVLGFEKSSPDEFAVVKRAPLALPPDYGLRPPKPGAPRPQAVSARSDARKSLLSSPANAATPTTDTQSAVRRAKRAQINAQAKGRSSSEVALLKRSGALGVDPNIRQTLNREAASTTDSAEDSLVDKLMFWNDKKDQAGPKGTSIIDAEAEARRIRENAALGKSATDGRTPVIRRKE